jgi:hypothetical protein
VLVTATNYSWSYAQASDSFSLRDARKRLIVSGRVQPAVIVAPASDPSRRVCIPSRASEFRIDGQKVTVTYAGVNGAARLAIVWRFDEHGIWTEPLSYDTPNQEDIVSVHYFSESGGPDPTPALHSSYLVVPGVSESSAVSPILRDTFSLNENAWLGRGGYSPGLLQQWGLPVHYFCGFSIDGSKGQQGMFTEGRSDAFVCGLSDLPAGDLFLQMRQGHSSVLFDYRSDLWKHMRGPGKLTLGATLAWSVAPSYYEAIAAYYNQLVQAGAVRKHQNSARKTAVALAPQFCTWGAQVSRNKGGQHLDQAFLDELYADLRASGMQPGLFSIDDKWEEAYGNLEHSSSRLPHFEHFLDQLRSDGYKIGLWAALMRCERPADIGLSTDNMLQQPDGKAYFNGEYYLLDFTQPAVAQVLTDVVRKFVRRYKPDLFKFDFGYELPPVSVAAPQDKNWTGERLMWKGLDIAIKAMREENPDLVVMYYQLSPLFLDYFDLHSTDDLFLAAGEYDLEANRRIYFSGLLGPLGIPTYGSSGYDWASAPNIWFDSAAAGTIGSLNDFHVDDEGKGATPALVAKFNGVARVLRTSSTFEVLPLGVISEAPTFGAHARSWARIEEGQLVLLAYRPPIPGEADLRSSLSTDSRAKDVIHSAAPVIVSSGGSESLTRSRKLRIVSYGSGEIALRREAGKRARVRTHYLRGNVLESSSAIENGLLRFTPQERDGQGQPLEWIEIDIS